MRRAAGQALVETLFVMLLLTAVFGAALQLCVLAVNDMLCNEAAFAAVRAGVVTPAARMREVVDAAARRVLLPHAGTVAVSGVRVWDETVQGHDVRDHAGRPVHKHNANIRYAQRLMFASLIAPLPGERFLGGGDPRREQVARARLMKSPDEEYYHAAWPGARPFSEDRGAAR